LVIQALKTIGKDKVTDYELHKIKELLKQEKPYHLQHDMKIAPEWIRQLVMSRQGQKVGRNIQ
jgi:hypothetical protein